MPLDGTNFEQQDEVLDLLMRGRERIARPGGWIQDTVRCGNAVCAVGAISTNATEAWSYAFYCLMRALPDFCNPSVIDYNDTPGRTQAEIVALYNRAIAMRERTTQDNANAITR